MFRISQPDGNGSYRIRPSKGLVLTSVPIGILILVFSGIEFARSRHPNYMFLVLWLVVGLGILGFNLWAAFSKHGSLYRMDKNP